MNRSQRQTPCRHRPRSQRPRPHRQAHQPNQAPVRALGRPASRCPSLCPSVSLSLTRERERSTVKQSEPSSSPAHADTALRPVFHMPHPCPRSLKPPHCEPPPYPDLGRLNSPGITPKPQRHRKGNQRSKFFYYLGACGKRSPILPRSRLSGRRQSHRPRILRFALEAAGSSAVRSSPAPGGGLPLAVHWTSKSRVLVVWDYGEVMEGTKAQRK